MKAIVLEKKDSTPLYHDARLTEVPVPTPTEDGQALVKMDAVAFNHREVWIRKGQYPGIKFGAILGADGVGKVVNVKSGARKDLVKGDRVLLMPSVGWNADPRGPEDASYSILGGGREPGVFAEYALVHENNLVKAPDHLSDAEAAALPLAGLTAWRAVFTKGQVRSGQNVLITGIGGGVALFALAFCVAAGANVFVTSSDDSKIVKAVSLGAKGGINYRDETWGKKIMSVTGNEFLDTVIDGAGGAGMRHYMAALRPGGVIVSYGMTTGPKVDFTMSAVLKNIEIRGSTMGSRDEFHDMVSFVQEHKIKPVVSRVWQGLEFSEEAFETMRSGKQFGKLHQMLRGREIHGCMTHTLLSATRKSEGPIVVGGA
ncbi:hypothetical protein DFQ27_004053 [Actinomortierella ambigua]|uniref:Enoyl reductase (ER) domain-containing protein n=1 Tax=Actinomortierella ambigua TaxID=1343610 RepID=A0A9P6Q2Z0_9FUNG|nr:hypothetical protein DFQ27_004053 [Actinomortierella ambigua]